MNGDKIKIEMNQFYQQSETIETSSNYVYPEFHKFSTLKIISVIFYIFQKNLLD